MHSLISEKSGYQTSGFPVRYPLYSYADDFAQQNQNGVQNQNQQPQSQPQLGNGGNVNIHRLSK